MTKITPEMQDEARARALWNALESSKHELPWNRLAKYSKDHYRMLARAIREADDTLGVMSVDVGRIEAMRVAFLNAADGAYPEGGTREGINAAIRAGAIGDRK